MKDAHLVSLSMLGFPKTYVGSVAKELPIRTYFLLKIFYTHIECIDFKGLYTLMKSSWKRS
jgi:hypothetical protein